LGKETPNLLGEEENTCISKNEAPPCSLGNFDVYQDIVNPPFGSDPALANSGIIFFSVEVLRIPEFFANG
jgi:hypothetical protein